MNTLLQKLNSINLLNGDCQLLSEKNVQHKYKLLLKQHWETGINYLCITKKNWKKYSGKCFGGILVQSTPNLLFVLEKNVGLLMCDKNRNQVYSNLTGHNRKERNE
jgi:hypothetical protein